MLTLEGDKVFLSWNGERRYLGFIESQTWNVMRQPSGKVKRGEYESHWIFSKKCWGINRGTLCLSDKLNFVRVKMTGFDGDGRLWVIVRSVERCLLQETIQLGDWEEQVCFPIDDSVQLEMFDTGGFKL
jgi:hypothetical protein